MIEIGELAFWGAVCCAVWAVVANLFAVRHPERPAFAASGARAMYVLAALLALAVAGVIAMLLRPDFSYAFAASSTASNLLPPERLVALLSRAQGVLLMVAVLIAIAVSLAPSSTRGLPRVNLAAGVVLLTLLLALMLFANPYARASAAVGDGSGLGSGWRLSWTVYARLAALSYFATLGIVLIRLASDSASRSLIAAIVATGLTAILFALRRSIAGPDWGALDWIIVATMVGSVLGLRLSLPPLRLPATRGLTKWALASPALACSSALAMVLASVAFSHPQTLTLRAEEPARVPQSAWNLISDGRSIYTQLDRRVLAVVIDARLRDRAVQRSRPEWRIYLDANGEEREQASIPAVVPSSLEYLVIYLGSPPTDNEASITVWSYNMFGLWWVALLLGYAALIVGAMRWRRAA